MARTMPLWRSAELSLHRSDHPPEHEDQPYEAVADRFMATFVECGSFDLEVGNNGWRLATGDVMLRHPGMRYRAGFEGRGFTDACLTLTLLGADQDRFDPAWRWAPAPQPVLRASNRLAYLRWALDRALSLDAPMLVEHCAVEIFRPHAAPATPLFTARRFTWYAERIHAARERLDTEFACDHSVAELARSVGMSMFHFSRVFRDLVGQPPHRYLAQVRLRAAQAMLRDGRSVTETCFACGFGNLSHFSRSFARRFAHAPSRMASHAASPARRSGC
jgi:AraC-like DNA-binding protein